jgi:hypothetical protein
MISSYPLDLIPWCIWSTFLYFVEETLLLLFGNRKILFESPSTCWRVYYSASCCIFNLWPVWLLTRCSEHVCKSRFTCMSTVTDMAYVLSDIMHSAPKNSKGLAQDRSLWNVYQSSVRGSGWMGICLSRPVKWRMDYLKLVRPVLLKILESDDISIIIFQYKLMFVNDCSVETCCNVDL